MKSLIRKHFSKEEIIKLSSLLKPPPEISGSEWANQKRILSKEDSAEPGRYNTSRAPFQKEPLDAITDPYVREVVMVWASQSGKTLMATNIIGYYYDQDPSPIMYVIETLAKAENFSKARLIPMIRDNPWMDIDIKSSNSSNTILEKFFLGGSLSIVGANSPAGMTSKPIRILILDEIDNYPLSAGQLGNPVALATQRTESYNDNRKIIKISTPGVEGLSNIWPAFEETDMRYYNVPCMHCGTFQKFIWQQLKFPDKIPDNCYYECIDCKKKLYEKDKFKMVELGKWIPTFPERKNKPGFHLSRLYSVFSPWSKMVYDFLSARKQQIIGNDRSMQVFINSGLALKWNPHTAPTSVDELLKRTESYLDPNKITLPSGVVLLTAGVDVQDDRLEILIDGWGVGEENWTIARTVLSGEPALRGLWNELDIILKSKFKHPLGISLGITVAGIDTGGHYSSQVYDFVRGKIARRIYAVKGSSQPGKAIAPKRPTYNNKGRIPLYFIGTSSAKDLIYGRLRITEPGPGFMHFDRSICDLDFFEQLTAEKKVRRKNGYEFEKLTGRRNEILDMKVYSLGALRIYNRNLKTIKAINEIVAKNVKGGKKTMISKPKFIKKPFATR